MKLTMKELAKEVEISESTLRTYACKPELACFTTIGRNVHNRVTILFDLNETSKRLLMKYKKNYKPQENENVQKYLDENVKLQQDNMRYVQALNTIKIKLRMFYNNENFKVLTKKETDNILKIIESVLK